MRRRHETEFYARQASILLENNACRSGNDRSPTLKVFFALSRGRRGAQRALNSVSCLLLFEGLSPENFWKLESYFDTSYLDGSYLAYSANEVRSIVRA